MKIENWKEVNVGPLLEGTVTEATVLNGGLSLLKAPVLALNDSGN